MIPAEPQDGSGFSSTAAAEVVGSARFMESHQLNHYFWAGSVVLEKAEKELGLMSNSAGKASGTY